MPSDLMFNASDEFEFVTEAIVVFNEDREQQWDLDRCNADLEAWYNGTLDPPPRTVLEAMGYLVDPVFDAVDHLMSQEATPDDFAVFLYPLTHDNGLMYGIWIAPSEDGFGLDPQRRESVLKEMKDLRHEKHLRHTEFQTRRYEVP